jgi:hypothetical protein
MFCPECGTEIADNTKSCTKCGRSLLGEKRQIDSGVAPGLVKLLIVLLVFVLIGGAGYFVYFLRPENRPTGVFSPEDRKWVPLSFDTYGISLEVPGEGWHLYYDTRSQKVFEDAFAKLDLSFIGVSPNPDTYRVDNKPQVFTILKQEPVTFEGWDGEALYTIVQGVENGILVNKHQLYFNRTFTTYNQYQRTYSYLITMTFSSGRDKTYAPFFRHLIDSIELYENK